MSGPARRLCSARIGGRWFGLPVERVQEVLRPSEVTPVPQAPAGVAGLLNLRGQIVEALDPRVPLGLAATADPRACMHVVLRGPDGPLSLLADEVGDVIEVPEEEAEPLPPTMDEPARRLFSAAARGRDGLLPVFDVDRLIEAGSGRRR